MVCTGTVSFFFHARCFFTCRRPRTVICLGRRCPQMLPGPSQRSRVAQTDLRCHVLKVFPPLPGDNIPESPLAGPETTSMCKYLATCKRCCRRVCREVVVAFAAKDVLLMGRRKIGSEISHLRSVIFFLLASAFNGLQTKRMSRLGSQQIPLDQQNTQRRSLHF